MTSERGAAASASTVGQRSSQVVQRGTTLATCVCWSITSLTSTAYGSRSVRHGRSRPFAANHARSRCFGALAQRRRRSSTSKTLVSTQLTAVMITVAQIPDMNELISKPDTIQLVM